MAKFGFGNERKGKADNASYLYKRKPMMNARRSAPRSIYMTQSQARARMHHKNHNSATMRRYSRRR